MLPFFGTMLLPGILIRELELYLTSRRYKSVHYHIFRDKTNQLKQRKCDGERVYFRLGGDKESEIFYLGSIPPGAKAEEAIDHIFIDLERLEQGIPMFYAPSQKEEIFYGGLLTVLGILLVLINFCIYTHTKFR